MVQLTASRKNTQESLEAERSACDQHRAAIAELAEEALGARVTPVSQHLLQFSV